MRFTLIDQEQAPRQRGARRPSPRRQLSEQLVAALVPGKVAKVDLGHRDTPRGVKASLTRAGKRHGRPVRSWDVNGTVYVELVQDDETPERRHG